MRCGSDVSVDNDGNVMRGCMVRWSAVYAWHKMKYCAVFLFFKITKKRSGKRGGKKRKNENGSTRAEDLRTLTISTMLEEDVPSCVAVAHCYPYPATP